MHAIRLHAFGPAENLRYGRTEDPLDRRDLQRIELKERAAGRVVSALAVPADMTEAEARDLLPGV
jgi:hypothetical protein